jgi:integrase
LPSIGSRLLVKQITALTPKPGQQYVCWDGDLAGFGVRVSPAGAKTFILKYRTKAGRVRWATIGRVGAIALDEARDKARRMTGQVADGKDPLRELDASKGAVTVRDAATRFLTEHVAAKKKPRTHGAYKQIIDTAIAARLGTVPIRDISTDDAIALHYRLRATPTHANRCLAVLSSLLSWCQQAKLFPKGPNPCQGIERYPERKRRRYLTRDEYARLGQALEIVTRTEAIGPIVRTAIELLLLTGARPIEIASLEWGFVDLAGAALRLPVSKTGEKTIHLSPAAVDLLQDWPRWANSPFVFPGTRRGVMDAHLHGSTLSHAWHVLRTMANLSDVRLYDACRHSYASEAISRHGLTLAAIGEQLGHSQPATTARYAHLHDEVARTNASKIGGTIAAALRKRVKA